MKDTFTVVIVTEDLAAVTEDIATVTEDIVTVTEDVVTVTEDVVTVTEDVVTGTICTSDISEQSFITFPTINTSKNDCLIQLYILIKGKSR